jgi:hypothetical protein
MLKLIITLGICVLAFAVSKTDDAEAPTVPENAPGDETDPEEPDSETIAYPGCKLTAQLPDEVSPNSKVVLNFETSGDVTSAVLDMTVVEIEGGTKDVYPYRISDEGSEDEKTIIFDADEEAPVLYLASVSNQEGSATCVIAISRGDTNFPNPPSCTAEVTEEDDSANLSITVEGEATSIFINGTETDIDDLEKSYDLDKHRHFVVDIAGASGNSVCAATLEGAK